MPRPATTPSWQELPARRSPAGPAPRRSRRRRVVTLLVVAVLVAAATTAYLVHRAEAPFNTRGHFVIVGTDNFTEADTGSSPFGSNDECAGAGEYHGMGTDQPFDVTDADGRELASGTVFAAVVTTDPSTRADECELTFDIADIPSGQHRYDVSFYGRFRHELGADQMRRGFVIRSDDAGLPA